MKNGFAIERRSPTNLLLIEPSGARGVSWQCLPDTVDPRGPRGK